MAKAIEETRAGPQETAGDPIGAMVDADGLLTPEAEREAAVSDETLRELYRLMAIARRLDQEGLNLQRQGELGLWGPYAGHEAAQVGAALAMAPTDWIFPYYRDFAMAICRGIDPGAIMTIFRGQTHGVWDPHQYRFGPFVIPVGSQVPHAVGFALGCKLDHEQTAVLVGFGEGATSTGDWHEAMNFAAVFQTPVVFLCENNQWAISVPLREQVAGRIADRAAGYGFPGVRVDGADVEPWRARDPLARCAERLRRRGAFDADFERRVQQEADERAAAMRQTLLSAPPAHPGRVFDLVYANPPESLLREKAAFLADIEPEGGAQ